jgi:hypothetical protein
MQTVLYVSPMELGNEVQVRDIHERFPATALDSGIGIERLVAYIGSGYYALEITVADGDFQERFHSFLTDPDVGRFFRELSAHVRNLSVASEGTAEMPLATAMLEWSRDGGVRIDRRH